MAQNVVPDAKLQEINGKIEAAEAQIKAAEDTKTEIEKRIIEINQGIFKTTLQGEQLRDLRTKATVDSIKAKIKDAEFQVKIISEEAGELERWGKIAFDISESPETAPPKLMNKALKRGFSYITYEDKAVTASNSIKQWFDSVGVNNQGLETYLIGRKEPLIIAQAFPQYFNEFQYQGDESKLIESWYSKDSWKGVSTAYYQETGWRRSVLSLVQSRIIELNWFLTSATLDPDQSLPTQDKIKDLEQLLLKANEAKDQAEKDLAAAQKDKETYEAEFAKYKADFDSKGVKDSEDISHETAGAMQQARELSRHDNDLPVSFTPTRSSFGALPERRHFDKFAPESVSGSRSSAATRDTVEGNLAAAVKDPWWFLKKTILGPFYGTALEQFKNEQAVDDGTDYWFLSPDQKAIAQKFQGGGISYEDAASYAIVLDYYPQLSSLTLAQLIHAIRFINQGISLENAANLSRLSVEDRIKAETLMTTLIARGYSLDAAVIEMLKMQATSAGSSSPTTASSPGVELSQRVPQGSAPAEFKKGEVSESKFKSKSTEEALARINKNTQRTPSHFANAWNRVLMVWGIKSQEAREEFNPASDSEYAPNSDRGASATKQSISVATGLIGKGAKAATSFAAKKAALAALAASGVGAVPAALLAAKELLSKLPMLADGWSQIKRAFKKFLEATVALAFASPYSFVFGLGGAGAALAIPVVGPFLMPFGFAAGAWLGSTIKGASLFSGLGSVVGTGGILGSAVPVIIATGTIGLASMVTVVATAGAFVGQPQEEHMDQEVEVAFEVTKVASPQTSYPEYTTGPETITYAINIKALEDITITSAIDKMTLYTNDGEKNLSEADLIIGDVTLKSGESYQVSPDPKFTADGPEFKDTALTNVVTVVADTASGEQTRTVLETVTFGQPPTDQPYGYPIAGTIKTIGTVNGRKVHCGTFFNDDGTTKVGCLPGGMDISAGGNSEVRSTLNGKVVAAGFYEGNGERANANGTPCSPKVNATSKYTCFGFGGYVQIQDRSGRFNAVYLHLNEPTLKPGDEVTRGQEIGTLYPGTDLPNSSGPHVHYQIMSGVANVSFINSTGSCKQGNLLPSEPPLKIEAKVEKPGPFVCE